MIIIVFSVCINLKFVFEAILSSLCKCGCNCSSKAVQVFRIDHIFTFDIFFPYAVWLKLKSFIDL